MFGEMFYHSIKEKVGSKVLTLAEIINIFLCSPEGKAYNHRFVFPSVSPYGILSGK